MFLPQSQTRWILPVAAILAVAAAAFACSPKETPVALLFEAQTAGMRWHEGRSSFDAAHRPYDPARIEGPADPDRLEGELFLAEERGARLAPLAKIHFLVWRNQPGDLERAMARLARLPREPAWWNERTLAELSAGDAIGALDSAASALSLAPDDLPALFNRAVAMERLGLAGGAAEAWASYLERDADGGWAREAAARLEALRRPADESPGIEAERRRLGDEIRATTSATELEEVVSRPANAALLSELASLGDRLLASEIEVRRTLDAAEWARSVERASRMKREFEAALAGGPSIPALQALERSPEPSISLQALRVRAFDALLRRPPGEAFELFGQVIARCAELECPVESALASSDQGSLLLQAGDYRRAEHAFRTSLERLPASFTSRRAEVYEKLAIHAAETGAPQRAIELGLQAAAALRPGGDRGSLAGVNSNLGGAALQTERPSAALALLQEARRIAHEAGRLSTELYAMGGAVRALTALGRGDEAETLAHEALAIARNTDQRSTLVALLAAEARRHFDGGRVRDAAQEALEAAELAGDLGHLPRRERALALLGKARAAEGDTAAAERTLAEAISLNDATLPQVRAPLTRALRRASSAESRGLLARIRSERGDAAAAWAILSGAGLRALDEDECTIAFVAQDEMLLVWSATSAGTRFDQGPLDRTATTLPVFSTRRCPENVRRVTVLETDSTLAGIGSRSVRLARPDVRVIVARRPDTSWPERRLDGPGLAIHGPQPMVGDRLMPALPGAAKEARLVLAAWPESAELAGPRATPAEVAAAADRFDLIHFGVHAESRSRAGASSYLMLAGDDGYLQVVDVLRLSLSDRRPVVVMSACRGGGETFEKEKDGAGLPWAFLEAGAQVVIAFQDDLDDRAALDFSAAFYPLVGSGVDVEEAFERALESLRARWPAEVVASFAFYV